VILAEAKTGETRGRIIVSSCLEPNGWLPLGKVALPREFLGRGARWGQLGESIDRAISAAFVTVKPVRRTAGARL